MYILQYQSQIPAHSRSPDAIHLIVIFSFNLLAKYAWIYNCLLFIAHNLFVYLFTKVAETCYYFLSSNGMLYMDVTNLDFGLQYPQVCVPLRSCVCACTFTSSKKHALVLLAARSMLIFVFPCNGLTSCLNKGLWLEARNFDYLNHAHKKEGRK